jgi:hypothetical protein
MIKAFLNSSSSNSNMALLILLYGTQVWTIGLPSFSVAIASLLVASVFAAKPRKLHPAVHIVAIAAIASSIYIGQPVTTPIFQYSLLFSIATIVNLLAAANIIHAINNDPPFEISTGHLYIAALLCFFFIAICTPEALTGTKDGAVGLFNEKGLAGYYLGYVGMELLVRRNRCSRIVATALICFGLFILQSGRQLSIIAAIALLFLDQLSIKKKLRSLVVILLTISAIMSTSYFSEQLIKIDLLQTGQGGVGRYAAAYILSQLNVGDLLVGHGYGSYLAYRIDVPELPDGSPYDYAGSVIFELIFEIGLILTVALILLVCKFTFKKVTLLKTLATTMLLAFGVKHDVQMLTGVIFAAHMNKAYFTSKDCNDLTNVNRKVSAQRA